MELRIKYENYDHFDKPNFENVILCLENGRELEKTTEYYRTLLTWVLDDTGMTYYDVVLRFHSFGAKIQNKEFVPYAIYTVEKCEKKTRKPAFYFRHLTTV